MSYFSRVTLKSQRLSPEKLAPLLAGDGYKEHQALWRLFADKPEAERDFLFRKDDMFQGLRYFVVSQRQPSDLDGLWQIESKPYTPTIQQGQSLAFSLRANPIVKRKGEDGKSRRHDVVMDAKHRHRQAKPDVPVNMPELVQAEGFQWLERRAERYGFSVNKASVCVESYDQHKSAKKDKRISYSTLDMTGVVTVESPILFAQALMDGIGPAKAFGCGLMLVRRA